VSESSGLKEADLLDATVCLYKLGADKACHRWSVMLKRERMSTSIAEFKQYLTLSHGFKEVATSFGVMKFSTTISIHRHMKEPQFPNGRIFLCTTQDEWLIYLACTNGQSKDLLTKGGNISSSIDTKLTVSKGANCYCYTFD